MQLSKAIASSYRKREPGLGECQKLLVNGRRKAVFGQGRERPILTGFHGTPAS